MRYLLLFVILEELSLFFDKVCKILKKLIQEIKKKFI